MATPGKLRREFDDEDTMEAACGPDGWTSPNKAFARQLETLYPSGDTVCGVPWVRAFWLAASELGMEVLAEPVPDEEPPGVVY